MPRQLSIFDFKQKCNMLLHNILSIITSELFFHMKVCLKSKACPGLDYPGNALSNKTGIINTLVFLCEEFGLVVQNSVHLPDENLYDWFDIQCIAEQQNNLLILIFHCFSSQKYITKTIRMHIYIGVVFSCPKTCSYILELDTWLALHRGTIIERLRNC